MSIKGQSNFIGTNGQAMVSLKFILHYYNYPNFLKFTIEGVDYEDFTLFFRDQTDNWRYNAEVKWKNKKISFSNFNAGFIALKLPWRSTHICRHTFATLALMTTKKPFCCSSQPWTFGTEDNSSVCKNCCPLEFRDRGENIFSYL